MIDRILPFLETLTFVENNRIFRHALEVGGELTKPEIKEALSDRPTHALFERPELPDTRDQPLLNFERLHRTE